MNSRSIYVRLIQEAYPFWKWAFFAVLAMLACAFLEPLLPALMAPLVDESLIAREPDSLIKIPLLIVGVFLMKGIAEYFSTIASQTVAQKTIASLREKIFSIQLDLPDYIHQRTKAGRLLSRLTYDVEQVADAVSTAWMILIKDSLVIIGLLSFLIYTSWQLTITLFIVTPIIVVIVKWASSRMRKSNKKLQEWIGIFTGLIEESLEAIRDIKIFSSHKERQKKFEFLNQKLLKEKMRVIKIQALNVPLVQTLAAMTIGVVIIIGTQMSVRSLLTPGEFVAYITAMGMIFDPVRRLTGVNSVIQRGLAAADSIYYVFDQPRDGQLIEKSHSDKRQTITLALENVCFSYPDKKTIVLSNISFKINHGETLSIIGPSGSGKTTIFNIISGFLAPNSGRVLINGVDSHSLPLAKLRSFISLVGQNIHIFDASISENIKVGNRNATNEEIIEAAKQANALEFIEKLPHKFDYPCGRSGSQLSGGQKQRIAIARAILKNAPLLLLDEPTSSLDIITMNGVLESLEKLKSNRTTLIISHHPTNQLTLNRVISLQR